MWAESDVQGESGTEPEFVRVPTSDFVEPSAGETEAEVSASEEVLPDSDAVEWFSCAFWFPEPFFFQRIQDSICNCLRNIKFEVLIENCVIRIGIDKTDFDQNRRHFLYGEGQPDLGAPLLRDP